MFTEGFDTLDLKEAKALLDGLAPWRSRRPGRSMSTVTEKAELNPLFAEEIVSYLTERGLIRNTVEFDASALAAVTCPDSSAHG